jgi:hypothetical protein
MGPSELNKRKYIKPVVNVIAIDNSISLVMMTPPPRPPKPPMPRGSSAKGDSDSPFASPFSNSPFE